MSVLNTFGGKVLFTLSAILFINLVFSYGLNCGLSCCQLYAYQDDIMDSMLEYASPRLEAHGLPFHTLHGVEACSLCRCGSEIHHRDQFLPSHVAYHEKGLQKCVLEEAGSLSCWPTFPSVCVCVCVCRSRVLRLGLLG